MGLALLIPESVHQLGGHEHPKVLLKTTEANTLTPGYVHQAVPE
jgi:hypothetical protein